MRSIIVTFADEDGIVLDHVVLDVPDHLSTVALCLPEEGGEPSISNQFDTVNLGKVTPTLEDE